MTTREKLEKEYGDNAISVMLCSFAELPDAMKDDSQWFKYLEHELREAKDINGKSYVSAVCYYLINPLVRVKR